MLGVQFFIDTTIFAACTVVGAGGMDGGVSSISPVE